MLRLGWCEYINRVYRRLSAAAPHAGLSQRAANIPVRQLKNMARGAEC